MLCLLFGEKLGQLNYPARRIKAKIIRNLFSEIKILIFEIMKEYIFTNN